MARGFPCQTGRPPRTRFTARPTTSVYNGVRVFRYDSVARAPNDQYAPLCVCKFVASSKVVRDLRRGSAKTISDQTVPACERQPSALTRASSQARLSHCALFLRATYATMCRPLVFPRERPSVRTNIFDARQTDPTHNRTRRSHTRFRHVQNDRTFRNGPCTVRADARDRGDRNKCAKKSHFYFTCLVRGTFPFTRVTTRCYYYYYKCTRYRTLRVAGVGVGNASPLPGHDRARAR